MFALNPKTTLHQTPELITPHPVTRYRVRVRAFLLVPPAKEKRKEATIPWTSANHHLLS